MTTWSIGKIRTAKWIAHAACLFSLTIAVSDNAHGAETGILDMRSVGPRTESVALETYHRILHVSAASGADDAGAGAREKPWKTLVAALAAIENAAESNRVAILCAAGRYDAGTLTMKPYVDLFGGFDPKKWSRDIFQFQSILDGRGVRRVVVGASHARLDGFVITRGVARSHGGGILCDDTSPLISNNVIADNLVLEPENFNPQRIHQSGNLGGGIACLYNAAPVIRNNLLKGNRTSVGNGGGIAFYGWLRAPGISTSIKDNRIAGGQVPVLENNVILGNQAGINDTHRTRSSNGGAVSCAHESRPTIRNNVIAGNQALGRGDAGGIYVEYYSDPWVVGNWIVGNSCEDDGGGFYTMRLGQPLLEQNIIAGNWSTGGGVGGVRLSKEGRARLLGNWIVRNQSGGGVTSDDSYLEMEGNVVMDNQGGPALTYDMNFTYLMPSRILRNILRSNEQGAIRFLANVGRPPVLEDNNIQGRFDGKGNFDRETPLRQDGFSGTTVVARSDPSRGLTTLRALQPAVPGNALAGRVIRIGTQWSVIKEVKGNELVVWGNLDAADGENQPFEVIPSYRLEYR